MLRDQLKFRENSICKLYLYSPPLSLDDSINFSQMILKHNEKNRKLRWVIRGTVMIGMGGIILERSWGWGSDGEKAERLCQGIRQRQLLSLHQMSHPSQPTCKRSKEMLSKKIKRNAYFFHSELYIFSHFNISAIGVFLTIDDAS